MAETKKGQENGQEKEAETKEARSQDLEELLAQLGGPEEVRISVFRYDTRNQQEFVETIAAPVHADVMEEIQGRYGGGKYLLQFRVGRKIRANRTIRVAGPSKPLPGEEAPEEEPEEDPVEAMRQETELERLRRELEEKTERLRQKETSELFQGLYRELRDLREEVRRPPPDAEKVNPLELAISLVGTLQSQTQPYLQALLERKPTEPAVETMMDAFFRGLEAAERMRTDGEYSSVIREVGKPLVETLGKAVEQRGLGTTIGADGTAMAHPNPPAQDWRQVFGPYLPHLVRWADQGLNPELRAAVVVEEMPDRYLDVVGEAVHRDGFLEEFLAAVPQAQPHRAWFHMFLGGLRDGIQLESEVDVQESEDDGPPPGGEEEGSPEGVEVGTGTPPSDDE